MKFRIMKWVLSAVIVFLSAPAFSQSIDVQKAQAIAKKSLCLGCHAVDKKMVGPAFQQVAIRYKTDLKAKEKLTQKIRQGGAGVWGVVAMPANQKNISDSELDYLLQWILLGAPTKN